MRKWERGINFAGTGVPKIPVWIQMYNVPVELWTAEGLSYLASAVGEPLYANSLTELKRRLSFARICVLIDASKPIVKQFGVNLSDHDRDQDPVVSLIRVSYQWIPPVCEHCKVFGHSSGKCSKFASTTNQPASKPSSAGGGQVQGSVWRVVGHKGKDKVMEDVTIPLSQEGEAGPSRPAEESVDMGDCPDTGNQVQVTEALVNQELMQDQDLSLVIDLSVVMDPLLVQVPDAPNQVCDDLQGDQTLSIYLAAEVTQEEEGVSVEILEEERLVFEQKSKKHKKDRRKKGLLAGPHRRSS